MEFFILKEGGIMGGKEASRGFLYQGFASVLEALTDGNNWDKIYVEFPSSNDKVDIALGQNKQIIKCIQVKSSINTFAKADIQNWIKELMDDTKCPEYELFLIGQCANAANIFIKSVEKYYAQKPDNEATLSLNGFDTNLLAGKKIKFVILPFDINILEKIVRDSLHKYISYKNRMMTFDQIKFIASATVTDQMISSTHGEGMDKTEFDENLEKHICLVAGKYPPERVSIGIKSFSFGAENLEKETESCLSFIDKFNKRELKGGYSWNNDIYNNLSKFLLENTNNRTAYQLFLNTHSSIAFAAGRILNSKSGINIFPVQKTADNGIMLWDIKFGKKTDYSNWDITYEQLQAEQPDSALILNVTRNIHNDVIRFIRDSNLTVGTIINCIPNEAGATNISIKNGTHAALLANNVYNAIAVRNIVERRAVLHIFASAPNAFMFFLGQNSAGFGKCILYEYDYEQMNSCTYSQSISFIN